MVDDKDIWYSAQVLVKRYGQDAEFRAAERCDAMIEAGDRAPCFGISCSH